MHKKDNMMNVLSDICNFENCNIRPNFNYIQFKKGLYCEKHKKEEMINVTNKICENNNCNIRANYNYNNLKNGKFCLLHKLKDMIDVTNKKCIYNSCDIRPHYNYENINTPIYCFNHKIENMINVVSYSCEYNNCETRAGFNFIGFKKGRYCREHKLKDMIKVTKIFCCYTDCNKEARFNYDNMIARYCIDHKLNNMINVVDKRCKTILCDTQISNPQYDGYCLRCFIHLNPDKLISKNYKTKESTVTKYLIDEFPKLKWIVDKKIENGDSKRRPDLLLNLDNHVIIVEIDENQHKDYDCSCEDKRIMEISKDLNHKPIIFIRFNPDDYINKEGKKIKSPWIINKLGLCSVSNDCINEWENRLDKLADTIDYWVQDSNKINKTIYISKLFYNQVIL